MFTGIIRNQGKIARRVGSRLVITAPRKLVKKLQPGGSIAVNGVCLTVEVRSNHRQRRGPAFLPKTKIGGREKQEVRVSVMPETAKVTALGKLPVGSQVNLELPLKLSDTLDGHLVQGHVDGTGTVASIKRQGQGRILEITLPPSIAHLVAAKGSIAVDGVSLTVITADRKHFTVGLIPETLRRTTLGKLRVGDAVNLEADLIARYLQQLRKR